MSRKKRGNRRIQEDIAEDDESDQINNKNAQDKEEVNKRLSSVIRNKSPKPTQLNTPKKNVLPSPGFTDLN